MAKLELGVDVTVEGAAKLTDLSKGLRNTGDDLGDLAKNLDEAADAARRMQEDINKAADGIDFSGANNAAQRFEDTGEGLRNFANGASDAFTAATDSSLSFQERFTLAAGGVADVANGMRNAIIPALQNISSGAITSAVSVAQSVAKQVAAWALLGVQSLLNAAKVAAAWLIAMGPIALIVAAVVALVAAIVLNWDKIVAFVKKAVGFLVKIIEGFVDFFTDAWNGILDFLGDVGEAIVDFGKHLWEPIGKGFEAAVDFIKGIWNAFVRFWNSIQISVPSVDIPLVGKVGGFTIGLPDLPRLATGGIVTDPTLALIAEKGPEAVIPLNQAAAMGTTIIEVTVLGDLKAEDEKSLADAIGRVWWANGFSDSVVTNG